VLDHKGPFDEFEWALLLIHRLASSARIRKRITLCPLIAEMFDYPVSNVQLSANMQSGYYSWISRMLVDGASFTQVDSRNLRSVLGEKIDPLYDAKKPHRPSRSVRLFSVLILLSLRVIDFYH